MVIKVRLCPPLNNSAGQERVRLVVPGGATVGVILNDLARHFGAEFRHHLFDTQERVIPAWCAFINGDPIRLNRPENLDTVVYDDDELVLLLNIAGG